MSTLLLTLLLSPALAQDDAKGVRFSADAEVEAPSGKRYALIIGVDDYEDPSLADLRFTANDAAAMRDTLVASGLFTEATVTLMTPESEGRLKPTRNAIFEQVSRLAQSPDAEQIVFFFSGHGVGAAQSGVQQNLLMPMDASFVAPADSSVNLGRVMEILDASEATQKVLIIDACRSEVADGSKGRLPSFADTGMPYGEGTIVLYSTKYHGVSWEDEDKGLGVMTSRLIEGLAGPADKNGDGWITVMESFEYTRDAVWGWSNADGRLQLPFIAGEYSGEFVLTPSPRGALPERMKENTEELRAADAASQTEEVVDKILRGDEAPPEGAPLLGRIGGVPGALSYSGAAVTGASSAVIWGLAVRERRAFYDSVDGLQDETLQLSDIENPDDTAARANALGYMAQATTGVAIGLAATGLAFTFLIDEPQGALRWTGTGLQLRF